jgi:regulation of enolase protein 1 (concanavalin A-like superfamily)
MQRFVCLSVCLLVCVSMAASTEAATLTVCANGCAYSNLQPAIDHAAGGDVILLRAGETFVGNVVLRAKPSSNTSYITIRSDAPDSSFPAPGVRLIPPGKSGANVAAGMLPRLIGVGGDGKSTPVVRTEPGAHHYRLEFLDIDGTANVGYGTLVRLGENTSAQTSTSASPYSLVLDRVYIHGHKYKGQNHGVMLDGRNTDVLNSYISDMMSLADAQAIAGVNGAGPFRIINNYLEATGENIMFGGDDPRTSNLVPSDIEIRGNYFDKMLAWQQPVLQTVPRVTVSAGSSGSLSSGTHYFKIVAVMYSNSDRFVSAPSTEVAVKVGSGGSVSLSWTGVSGADGYRIYRGTSSNHESVFIETTGTSFVYTGSGESSGAPPSKGTLWTTKNLLELKNAQRVTIDGNVFEHSWAGFQNGYAVLLTPRNQGGRAPWSVVRDITITNNVLRHVGNVFDILGYDDEHTSLQTKNITIRNNVADDVGGAWGSGIFMVISSGPATITVDHNTFVHDGTIVAIGGPAVSGFTYTNNFSRHNTYGIKGDNHAPGVDTLNHYFPGAVFTGNVLAGGPAGSYPPGNFFPSVSGFLDSFVDYLHEEFALVSSSQFNTAGTDGTDIGIDAPALDAAFGAALSGDPGDDGSGSSDGTLPSGWMSQDIGTVGLPGSATQSSGTYTIEGAGADVWDTADAFHFAYEPMTGDATIIARVASLQGTQAWTKVGVMIRATTSASSAQAFMLVSKGKGLAFQRRTSNGAQSVHTAGPSGTAPRWVKLTRAGNTITASASQDGVSWTVVGQDSFSMPSTVLVGLAVSSHTTSSLAAGVFDHVTVSAGQGLPAGWASHDVGAVAIPGSASADGGTFTVKGNGADIWDTKDAFQFASTPLDADGSIVARVASVSGTEAWTKAGVMMRMTLDAGSAHAFMLVSKGKGLAFQRRTVTGGTSTHTSGGSGTAPRWVKLSRQGQVITASVSSDGVSWTVVGRDTLSITGPLEVGLAVTSHDTGSIATATFDNVRVSTTP